VPDGDTHIPLAGEAERHGRAVAPFTSGDEHSRLVLAGYHWPEEIGSDAVGHDRPSVPVVQGKSDSGRTGLRSALNGEIALPAKRILRASLGQGLVISKTGLIGMCFGQPGEALDREPDQSRVDGDDHHEPGHEGPRNPVRRAGLNGVH
jgi:hypothetical protein